MKFGKRHEITDTTDFCLRQLVTYLLRGNWCNGFWPLGGLSPQCALTLYRNGYRHEPWFNFEVCFHINLSDWQGGCDLWLGFRNSGSNF